MSGGGFGVAANGTSGLDVALSDAVLVPEPSTIALIGSALAGLAVLRRRRVVHKP